MARCEAPRKGRTCTKASHEARVPNDGLTLPAPHLQPPAQGPSLLLHPPRLMWQSVFQGIPDEVGWFLPPPPPTPAAGPVCLHRARWLLGTRSHRAGSGRVLWGAKLGLPQPPTQVKSPCPIHVGEGQEQASPQNWTEAPPPQWIQLGTKGFGSVSPGSTSCRGTPAIQYQTQEASGPVSPCARTLLQPGAGSRYCPTLGEGRSLWDTCQPLPFQLPSLPCITALPSAPTHPPLHRPLRITAPTTQTTRAAAV